MTRSSFEGGVRGIWAPGTGMVRGIELTYAGKALCIACQAYPYYQG